jgi:hypothetical protein
MNDPDTSATTVVRQRPVWPIVGTLFFGAFLALVGYPFLHLVFTLHPREWDFGMLALAVATAMFGAMTWAVARLLVPWRAVRITLSPAGYRDHRKGDVTIPWPEITGISVWHGSHKHLRLSLSPQMTDRLLGRPGPLRALVAWTWVSATPIYASGLRGLDVSPGDLERIAKAYAAAHGGLRPAGRP